MAQEQSQMRTAHLSKTSAAIVERKLLNKLEEIFRAFDADKNGFITADEISLDNVTAEMLEIYSPLLLEMEANGYSLD